MNRANHRWIFPLLWTLLATTVAKGATLTEELLEKVRTWESKHDIGVVDYTTNGASYPLGLHTRVGFDGPRSKYVQRPLRRDVSRQGKTDEFSIWATDGKTHIEAEPMTAISKLAVDTPVYMFNRSGRIELPSPMRLFARNGGELQSDWIKSAANSASYQIFRKNHNIVVEGRDSSFLRRMIFRDDKDFGLTSVAFFSDFYNGEQNPVVTEYRLIDKEHATVQTKSVRDPATVFSSTDFTILAMSFGAVDPLDVDIPRLVPGSRLHDDISGQSYTIDQDGTRKLVVLGEKAKKTKQAVPLGWLGIVGFGLAGGTLLLILRDRLAARSAKST